MTPEDPIDRAVRLGENRAIREWNNSHLDDMLPVTDSQGAPLALDTRCRDCRRERLLDMWGHTLRVMVLPCSKHRDYFEDLGDDQ